jgi:hypothetical protein
MSSNKRLIDELLTAERLKPMEVLVLGLSRTGSVPHFLQAKLYVLIRQQGQCVCVSSTHSFTW